MKISSPLNRQLTLGVLVIADPNRKEPMPSAPEFLRIAMSAVASVFSLTAALAAEQSVRPPQLQMETFGPLPGGRVGVVQDGLLHCFEPSQKGWRRCRDWQALELPADTQRVLGNERVLSVVREKQIDFYHTHANPSLDKSLPLESGWSAQRMTTGEYSTEPELGQWAHMCA